jgi:hypothetical protein
MDISTHFVLIAKRILRELKSVAASPESLSERIDAIRNQEAADREQYERQQNSWKARLEQRIYECEKQKQRAKYDLRDWIQVLLVIGTWLALIAAFAYVGVNTLQWRANEKAANAAASAANTAAQELADSKDSFAKTLEQMRTQAGAQEDAAKAAKSAADTAAAQLELTERPWVDAYITLDGPFDFNVNGANIHLKLILRNSGHSPAQYVNITCRAFINQEGVGAQAHRDEVCREATSAPFPGITLFPTVTFEQGESFGIGKQELDSGNVSRGFIIYPAFVACIAYRPTFNKTSVYHTAYVYDLVKVDLEGRPNRTFKIGEDIDIKYLRLTMHPFSAISAD